MKHYTEDQLWSVSPQEASKWLQKKAVVHRMSGDPVEGIIAKIGRNASPLTTLVSPEERTFTDLVIGDKFVDLREIKSLDIEE